MEVKGGDSENSTSQDSHGNSVPKTVPIFWSSDLAPQAGPQTVGGPTWGARFEDHFSATHFKEHAQGYTGYSRRMSNARAEAP